MTEKDQLRAFVVFVFLLVVLSLSTASFAAISVIPDVPGLHGGGYTPSLGQLQGTQAWPSGSYSPTTKSFSGTGTTSIGGKPLSIPVKIPLASTAGAIAKNAMKLNPTLVVGTLAAGWLFDQGLQYLEDQREWHKFQPLYGEYGNNHTWRNGYNTTCGVSSYGCTDLAAAEAGWHFVYDPRTFYSCEHTSGDLGTRSFTCYGANSSGPFTSFIHVTETNNPPSASESTPASDSDWNALPDPTDTPGVAAELPGAAYMPHGAPVGKPEYKNGDYPLGEPYKAPDGSTVQTMASVTNNTNNNTTNNYNNSVTVSTYNITTHNAAGEPVANPTPEPTDEKQDMCEKNPESLACAKFGTPDAGADLPKTEVPLTFSPVNMGGNASCPAPSSINAFGVNLALEYDSACTYAAGLKPVVIAVAFVTALFIIFGAPRSAQS